MWPGTTGDPALFLRAAAPLLAIEGHESLVAEARCRVEQIAEHLPATGMRQRFAAAEPVRTLARLNV